VNPPPSNALTPPDPAKRELAAQPDPDSRRTDTTPQSESVNITPGNALTQFANNKYDGPWTVSRISLEPVHPAFGKGDRVKAKARPDGPTMTVEYVPIPTSVDARYYSKSDEHILMRYRCRWKNKDGSESAGRFQEEELESVPVGGGR
jgi:uncharacterized protein YodC (DUF2158 family)